MCKLGYLQPKFTKVSTEFVTDFRKRYKND